MKRWLIAALVVAAEATSAWAGTRVVVLPFAGITADVARDGWIGRAVEQNMILALGHGRDVMAVAYPAKVEGVLDGGVAARAARAMRADAAVIGSYEVVEGQIRLTAQVIDGNTGVALSTAQVTGMASGLLALEDQLAEQTRVDLGAPGGEAPVMAAGPAQVPPAAEGGQQKYDPLGFGGAGYDDGGHSYFAAYGYPSIGSYGFPLVGVPGGFRRHHGLGGFGWQIFGDRWWISFGGGNAWKRAGNGLQLTPVPLPNANPMPRYFSGEALPAGGGVVVPKIAPTLPVVAPMPVRSWGGPVGNRGPSRVW